MSAPVWPGFGVGARSFGFPIDPPHLSVAVLDRSEPVRTPDRLAQHWRGAQVLSVDAQGRALVRHSASGPSLVLRPAAEFGTVPPAAAVVLGHARRGGPDADFWAVPVDDVTDLGSAGATPSGLRDMAGLLPDVDANLLVSAVALLNWHRLAPFCPRCGRSNSSVAGGWSRVCPEGHEEFPRTDTAVIVLVHDGADRMVLARQPSWPARRVSVLAGFVEAGEALETTVAREIGEEIGISVTDIAYLSSQPWPFPRSLMVGFAARAEPGAVLAPRDGEIEDARWVDRTTVRRALAAAQDWTGDPAEAEFLLPGHVSIARRMIEGWARL